MEEKSNTQHTEPFENIPAVEMPQPLVDLALKRYAFAAIFFCIGVAASICVKNVCGLIVAFPALYLLYLASSIRRDYKNGKITECDALCLSVRDKGIMNFAQNSYTVVFEAANGAVAEFEMPVRKNKRFEAGIAYRIYFHSTYDSTILATTGPIGSESEFRAQQS